MDSSTVATISDGPETAASPSYGLRQQVLSPLETLAQSISLIAPSTTPTLTVPLVFGLCGAGTGLAYLIALAAIVLVAMCVASFARESASPGSLYSYTRSSLSPAWSALTAWALFFAYVMTASSVIGGFLNYAYIFLDEYHLHVSPVLLSLVAAGGAMAVAYRDVKVSAELMLWIEAISVCLITFVVGITLWKHGLHFDMSQVRLRGVSAPQVRMGVMLAIFSFVGFESATTLGAEAREPLKTIPRAVIQSALLAGLFFIVCAYGEVLGFHGASTTLDASAAPFHYLSAQAGVRFVGPIIDAGVLVSMLAATLACVIAASRVLLLMAHHGLAHSRFGVTHARNETPGMASILAAVLAFVPVGVLAHRGASGADIYGWMGTLAVFGFLTAYTLAAIALAVHLRREQRLSVGSGLLAAVATVAMIAALLWNIFPVPPAPQRYFPYIYLVYLVLAMAWYGISKREA
ncbi:APC family permease [Granulicella mallensis]|uniref:Amino acid transporter n=1 Tax=Granulicella mallensis TaxID=940614 RepID=A0A7W8EBQ9_9BACT|nr:APC family permease [Granulicella mallensis]MBB5064805.1 amino acid transporter [Granulicella mallensis]